MTQADYEEVSNKASSLFQYGQVSSLFLLQSVRVVKYSGDLETTTHIIKFCLRLYGILNKEKSYNGNQLK